MCGNAGDDPSMHDASYDGSQYRNHALGCTADYNHSGGCVADVGCRTFSDPEERGICADCGQKMQPNHSEISYGPVTNPDGSPTEFTKMMLQNTGRSVVNGKIV